MANNYLYYKISFLKRNNQVTFYSSWIGNCPNCRLEITTDILFVNKPLFIFIEADKNPRESMLIGDYPDQIVIDNYFFFFFFYAVQ
jgi:hypothetical protein